MTINYVTTGSVAGVSLFSVHGPLTDDVSGSTLGVALRGVIESGQTRLLVDLGDCPEINTQGMRAFQDALRDLQHRGWVGVVGADVEVLQMFTMVGILEDRSFRTFVDIKEAIREIESPSPG
jgi:hypothetical protein